MNARETAEAGGILIACERGCSPRLVEAAFGVAPECEADLAALGAALARGAAIRVVIVHAALRSALAEALRRGDDPETEAALWRARAQALAALFRAHRDRVSLVPFERLAADAAETLAAVGLRPRAAALAAEHDAPDALDRLLGDMIAASGDPTPQDLLAACSVVAPPPPPKRDLPTAAARALVALRLEAEERAEAERRLKGEIAAARHEAEATAEAARRAAQAAQDEAAAAEDLRDALEDELDLLRGQLAPPRPPADPTPPAGMRIPVSLAGAGDWRRTVRP